MKTNIKELVRNMTLEEKAGMCSGLDFWHTKPVERLGIPSVMVSDGPHGLRKQSDEADHLGVNDSIQAVCFPAACATACSFDRSLMKEMGEILGKECQAEGVSVLLHCVVVISNIYQKILILPENWRPAISKACSRRMLEHLSNTLQQIIRNMKE